MLNKNELLYFVVVKERYITLNCIKNTVFKNL